MRDGVDSCQLYKSGESTAYAKEGGAAKLVCKELRRVARDLKEVVTEQTLELRQLTKAWHGMGATPAMRPENSRMDCSGLTAAFGIERPD